MLLFRKSWIHTLVFSKLKTRSPHRFKNREQITKYAGLDSVANDL